MNKYTWAFWAKYVNIKLKLKENIYSIKIPIFLSNIIIVNFFLLINFIYLVINKILAIV